MQELVENPINAKSHYEKEIKSKVRINEINSFNTRFPHESYKPCAFL
jgi:hypothetical protein